MYITMVGVTYLLVILFWVVVGIIELVRFAYCFITDQDWYCMTFLDTIFKNMYDLSPISMFAIIGSVFGGVVWPALYLILLAILVMVVGRKLYRQKKEE